MGKLDGDLLHQIFLLSNLFYVYVQMYIIWLKIDQNEELEFILALMMMTYSTVVWTVLIAFRPLREEL